jgi:ATP-dependent 26S proteasome regulatory subunit
MRNKELYKSMLSAVQTISEEVKEKPFNQSLVQSLVSIAKPVADFFNLTTEETIVLCYFIDANLKDQIVNKESIITHFGKDITALADIDEIIESLNNKKLIFLTNRSRRFTRQFKFVHLNPKVPAAMAEGDVSLLGLRECTSFGDFLLEVNDLIVMRINEHISTFELQEEINQLMMKCKSLREIKWLKKQKKLKGLDLVVFLNICVEQSDGVEEVDIDKMISEVMDVPTDRIKYKQSIKSDRCLLFKENYVVQTGGFFGMANLVQLSDQTLDQLMQYLKSEAKKDFNPRMGNLINCEKIDNETLYYNERERKQIDTLKTALEEKNYKSLLDRMRKHNLVPGFTVLLYGLPGTGKTATVKALAKATGRHIFMVDIPKINSKWVGESEKNLSRLFDEYRRAKKLFSQDPILLFNEADAILGKRINTNSSVDKMNNSLQNILLQELEDFEGIFMATTNLADHLDGAFDRRLLYKVEFKKPEDHVRLEILQNAFPKLDDDLLIHINQDFPLTGGQIANIKKKILVKELLESNLDLEPALYSLCEDEFSLRKTGNRSQIGFVTHRKAS